MVNGTRIPRPQISNLSEGMKLVTHKLHSHVFVYIKAFEPLLISVIR